MRRFRVTALHWAALHRQPAAAAVLLKAGADPNTPLAATPTPPPKQSSSSSAASGSAVSESPSTSSSSSSSSLWPFSWSALELAVAAGDVESSRWLLPQTTTAPATAFNAPRPHQQHQQHQQCSPSGPSGRLFFVSAAALRCVAAAGNDRMLGEVLLPELRLRLLEEQQEDAVVVDDDDDDDIEGNKGMKGDADSARRRLLVRRYSSAVQPLVCACAYEASSRGYTRAAEGSRGVGGRARGSTRLGGGRADERSRHGQDRAASAGDASARLRAGHGSAPEAGIL